MKIGFAKDNLQQLQIDRETTVTGHFRKRSQQQLFLFEDYYNEERKLLGIETSFMEDFQKGRNTRGLYDEYRNAFGKARRELRDNYLEELKGQFEDATITLDTFGIRRFGLRTAQPELVYDTKFSLDGFVKRPVLTTSWTQGGSSGADVSKALPAYAYGGYFYVFRPFVLL